MKQDLKASVGQDPKGSVEETSRNIEEKPRDAEIAGHGEMVDEG
jgi:hypothetical protein